MGKIERIELSRYTFLGINRNETKNSVVNNGFDNLFPSYLTSLYNKSVTHQSIINDLVDYVVGYGLRSSNAIEQVKIDKFLPKKKQKKIVKFRLIQAQIDLELIKDPTNNLAELNVFNPDQIRATKIEEGEPVSFLYRKNWNSKSTEYKVKAPIPAFNDKFATDEFEGMSALFHWFDSGTFDCPYGRPDYLSGLDPIELEIAIYMMHNHGAQNGMFPSMIISKPSSGDPELDKQEAQRTQEQASGPAGNGKIITTYHQPGGEPPTFTTPNMAGIDKVYENQYVTAESGILKAHQIPSPSLIAGLNVKPTGFASPEAEMQWAKNTLDTKKIFPLREELLEALEPIFELLEINPENVEFEDVENKNRTAVTMSAEDALTDFISKGESEEELEGWELVDEREVDYDMEDVLDEEIKKLNGEALKMASTGSAYPNAKSDQDRVIQNVQYKTRYVYSGDATGDREFCKKMLAANKLYRKEDIVRMGDQAVNAGFGINGAATYSIWLYKGGVNCHHKWLRRTYRKEGKEGSIDVKNPNAKTISTNKAQREGYRVDNDRKVSMKPIDMPNQGRYSLKKAMNILKNLNL